MSSFYGFISPIISPTHFRTRTAFVPTSSRRSLKYLTSPRTSTSHGCAHPMRMKDGEPSPPSDINDGRGTSGMFGIKLKTNGDVLKFGAAAIAAVYAIKTGIQFAGVPDLLAGQITTAFVSIFSLLAWVSTYLFRVGTKGMTYAQQLREYEDEVIKKRFQELTEEELAALGEELDEEK